MGILQFGWLAVNIFYSSQALMVRTGATTIGPQMLSATLVELRRHPTLLDKVVARVNVNLPEPFNNFDIESGQAYFARVSSPGAWMP